MFPITTTENPTNDPRVALTSLCVIQSLKYTQPQNVASWTKLLWLPRPTLTTLASTNIVVVNVEQQRTHAPSRAQNGYGAALTRGPEDGCSSANIKRTKALKPERISRTCQEVVKRFLPDSCQSKSNKPIWYAKAKMLREWT